MGFANAGQGQAQQQGVPPLNAFDHIPYPGDPSGSRYSDQIPLGAASYFSPNVDLHNYQSVKLWFNWWNKGTNILAPYSAKVTLQWYADAGGTPAADPLATEIFYIYDNGQVGGILPQVYSTIFETPVKGYWLTYQIDPAVPALTTGVVYVSITGQYRTLLIPQYFCQSAYSSVGAGTFAGSIEERWIKYNVGKAAGGAADITYLPAKSGKAHANLSIATVTGATAFLLILDATTNERICGFSVPTTAVPGEYGQDFLVPNCMLKLSMGSSTAGFSNAIMSITFEN